MKHVLAFDFGASTGRAILGTHEKETLQMQEIHRFRNEPITKDGTLYWDFTRLFQEVQIALEKAGDNYDSIGFDTWGVDFGLLDKEGRLLENPVHYRDKRTEGIMEEVFQILPKEELYRITGTQNLNFNTIFQLYYLATRKPELLEKADKLLFMPDLFVYMLTGLKHTEYTIASTSGLLNAITGQWAYELMEKLGIPQHLFCDIIPAGSVYGVYKGKKVFYVGGHDTASAELAVPATEKDFVFISSGTWSLMGTELDEPELECGLAYQVTNEGCYHGKIRMLKNIMGLWLVQECRRQWIQEGTEVSFAQLEQEAAAARHISTKINVDSSMFMTPGDMPGRIRAYCRQTGQQEPMTRGETVRCIYESLAVTYRQVLRSIEGLTQKQYPAIYMVGGGTQAVLLCQLTADACGIPVIAGPVEATAMGNMLGQLLALGEIGDVTKARNIVASSGTFCRYEPHKQH